MIETTAADVGKRVKAKLTNRQPPFTTYEATGVLTDQGGTSAYVCIDGDNFSRVIPKVNLEWESK